MKIKLLIICLQFFLLHFFSEKLIAQSEINYISALKDTLHSLSVRTNNEFFQLHCESMIEVIDGKTIFSTADSAFLKDTYIAFNNEDDTASAKQLSTYLERRRPFILAWISPTDGQVSFSWFTPPANWKPDKKYPLYVQLHGFWKVASNTIEYMTYPF